MAALSLTVALLSGDAALQRELDRVCHTRGHELVPVARLRDLRRLPHPDVLVLDSPLGLEESLALARAVRAAEPQVAIVVVGGEDTPSRGVGGFRVVDRRWGGDRLGDDLELAYIGIPPALDRPA